MARFNLEAQHPPAGDQPRAIDELAWDRLLLEPTYGSSANCQRPKILDPDAEVDSGVREVRHISLIPLAHVT